MRDPISKSEIAIKPVLQNFRAKNAEIYEKSLVKYISRKTDLEKWEIFPERSTFSKPVTTLPEMSTFSKISRKYRSQTVDLWLLSRHS
jgi:hypothetical protein